MAFPTLSVSPTYPYSVTPEDNGIVSKSEFGYIHGRKRFTKDRDTHGLFYEYLTSADRVLLQAHIDLVGTHTSFSWTDPLSVAHTVRYVKIPKLELSSYENWTTSFELLEV